MYEVRYVSIGTIHTPFKEAGGMPVQPLAGRGAPGTVELEPEYCEGLKDLDGFSHVILIYHLHMSAGYSLAVRPYLDQRLRGLFSTRSPRRPNPIGISVVRLIEVDGCILHVRDLDIVDGTPLLDLKPYVPDIDLRDDIRTGWLNGKTGRVGPEPGP
jgi:tRNA-Thr(GGU) m(6)t(6)A37 methyltransferase TsaA